MSVAERWHMSTPGGSWSARGASAAAAGLEPTLVERLVDEEAPACRIDEPLSRVAPRLAGRELVPVVHDDDSMRFAGVVRSAELASSERHCGRRLEELRVRDVLGPSRWCWPSDSLEAALAIMRAGRVSELPVIDASQRLLGVVALADIARWVEIERAKHDAGELEHLLAETRAVLRDSERDGKSRRRHSRTA